MDHIVRSAIVRAQAELKNRSLSASKFSKGAVNSKIENAEKKEKQERGKKKSATHSDNDLIEMLEHNRAKIFVIGCGGGGSNTIERMAEVGIEGAVTLALNTDAQDLLTTKSDKKILIGRKLTRGLGAGSDPQIGESAARESGEEITEVLKGADLVFITCGLGGGTGTGSAPVAAEIAKSMKALTVAVVT
ncbi:MAG: hypothetical protein NTY48_06670, partial [Candidatus Diapherotrites archaeon]|nr:hypothetical protein [Candidatus Diapherotrites archaeon]